MNAESDEKYQRTHELLDAAKTANAGGETRKAIGLLIEAIEASTFGWGALDIDTEHVEEAPKLPDLRTIVRRGQNCVSVLNEFAQKRGVDLPRYDYNGIGPFHCTCRFMGKEVSSEEARRNKNEAKHDAAERMLSTLRGEG